MMVTENSKSYTQIWIKKLLSALEEEEVKEQSKDHLSSIKTETGETKPAAWDESNQILSVRPLHSFGTWFGMSRQGRVVFLVDPQLNNLSPVLRPVDFLLYLHRLKTFSCEMMGDFKDKQVPMKELAERFIMYDPFEADKGDSVDIFGKVRRYEITSTTALVVKRNKEVMFYERFWENGKWDDNDFTFNID